MIEQFYLTLTGMTSLVQSNGDEWVLGIPQRQEPHFQMQFIVIPKPIIIWSLVTNFNYIM